MIEDPDVNCPARDCRLCPRLADFRAANQAEHPEWFNAPVPSFGGTDAALLIVGLAPGRQGANRTGRPFTGDFAGILLFSTLSRFGLAVGDYEERIDDSMRLVNCRITNAVRCVPPENKPTPREIGQCGQFLRVELTSLPRLRAILALGRIAHTAILTTMDLRTSSYAFAHGALHALPSGLLLANSYHPSRLNTNTGRLTTEMFAAVFAALSSNKIFS